MKPRLRCAVYTRKSSEEGLQMEFNSLDAQREACLAYIESQKSEGWRPIAKQYDDGGYSGGNTNRPAMQALLSDVAAGLVDVIVVYKVDRLTRSLSDFAKIVDVLEQRGVSFVSVTQQFNTTSSMGRLTLNVLLSFAQFEREITGERIRDKIAASRRKGMWTGGNVPLGYQRLDRKLLPHQAEADVVRMIFERYVATGCVRRLQIALQREGIRGKRRRADEPAAVLSRGALYLILRNPIYVGKIRYRQELHQGQHEPIVEEALWQRVQALLTDQMGRPRGSVDPTHSPPLAGLLYDADGERMTPSTTRKGQKRYRYYVSRPLFKERSEAGPNSARLPADQLESAVLGAFADFIRDPVMLGAAYDAAGSSLAVGMVSQIGARLSTVTDEQFTTLFATAITKVVLTATGVELTLNLSVMYERAHGTELPRDPVDHAEKLEYVLCVPLVIRQKGQETRIALPGRPEIDTGRQPGLVRAIARGREWWQKLLEGNSLEELCKQSGVSDRYIQRLLPLAFLSPRIVTAIVEGNYPSDLTLERLLGSLKLNWRDQAKAIGQ
jgi:site-specific DNA recombinase